MLPIYFKPKVFKSIINICTETNADLFISQALTARSTILLSNEDEESRFIIASGCNSTSGVNGVSSPTGILVYPSESPNDSNYFNYLNKLNVPDLDKSEDKVQAIDDYLYNYDPTKDESGINLWDTIADSEKVYVGDKEVIRQNYNNENIPVLYDRDYILGHYEGHALSSSDSVSRKKDWLGDTRAANTTSSQTTKLSWIRFDKLVWDLINEITNGKVRHIKGRYTNLGNDENSIEEFLFNGIGKSVLSNKGNIFLEDTAPILGNGV